MTRKVFSFAFILFAICFISAQTHTDAESTNKITNTVTQTGIGLGSVIAVVCSWDRNRSILWAIIHGIFGWLYVIYFAISRKE
ncbi:hypothetical protein ACFQO9_09685 [Chryseobacterium zhengzhouense]|uniref:CPBP family intramembrane metalloprotease n=1 Tax=Chryseobacterium zhengzhouense TaxID=1636086 RepID=A0ABW2M0H7_9FLAO